MAIVTFIGPIGSGKTTAIKMAKAALEKQGYQCLDLDARPSLKVPYSFKGVVFLSTIKEGALRFHFSNNTQESVKVWVDFACNEAKKKVAEWKGEKFEQEVHAAAPVAHPGFLVWNPNGPHRPGYIHKTEEAARSEAARLSETYPDNSFFVMAPIAGQRATTIVQPSQPLTTMPASADFDLDSEIPF